MKNIARNSFCRAFSILLLSLPVSSAALASFSFTCPANGTIQQHTIQHSFNCSYSAESDGVEFGGFNNCGLADLDFGSAQISQVNGYWSVNCLYTGSGMNNTMVVGPDPIIEKCTFPNGGKTCSGSTESCEITCPRKPTNGPLKEKSGAFPGCFSVTSSMDGAPSLHLSLIFSTNNHTVNGHARVLQPLQDPLILEARAHGSYLTLSILSSPYFVVTGNGYPELQWPSHGGVGPVLLPILEFRMNTPTTFSFGGKQGELPGKGSFRYRTGMSAEWSAWIDGSVEKVECSDAP